MSPSPLRVFIMYAHEDKDVRDKLLRHLRVQVVRGDIELWSDHEIKPGDVWDEAIRRRLTESDLILLLLSDDFFNSDYIQNVELQAATYRHAAGECRLLPVVARDCDWQDHPFLGRIQALPPGGKPVKSRDWNSEDEPYRAIVDGVKTAVRELRRQPAAAVPTAVTGKPASALRPALLLLGLLLAGAVGWWAWSASTRSPVREVQPESPSLSQLSPDTARLANEAVQPTKTTDVAKPGPKRLETANPVPSKQQIQPAAPPTAAPVFDRSYETAEGMQRGKKGKKFAFRNTATDQVYGWYDDAEPFSGGRAYVKQNGRYFYIDKTGKCVEDCQ